MVHPSSIARPLLGVGAIIFDGPQHDVLLIERKWEPAQGLWSVPGGAVEGGESLVEACVREVREEVGLEVVLHPQPVKILDRLRHNADGSWGHYVIVDFVALSFAGTPRAGSDAAQAKFCGRSELAKLQTTQGLATVIEEALAVRLGRYTGRRIYERLADT